jgi:hypothetical protein
MHRDVVIYPDYFELPELLFLALGPDLHVGGRAPAAVALRTLMPLAGRKHEEQHALHSLKTSVRVKKRSVLSLSVLFCGALFVDLRQSRAR